MTARTPEGSAFPEITQVAQTLKALLERMPRGSVIDILGKPSNFSHYREVSQREVDGQRELIEQWANPHVPEDRATVRRTILREDPGTNPVEEWIVVHAPRNRVQELSNPDEPLVLNPDAIRLTPDSTSLEWLRRFNSGAQDGTERPLLFQYVGVRPEGTGSWTRELHLTAYRDGTDIREEVLFSDSSGDHPVFPEGSPLQRSEAERVQWNNRKKLEFLLHAMAGFPYSMEGSGLFGPLQTAATEAHVPKIILDDVYHSRFMTGHTTEPGKYPQFAPYLDLVAFAEQLRPFQDMLVRTKDFQARRELEGEVRQKLVQMIQKQLPKMDIPDDRAEEMAALFEAYGEMPFSMINREIERREEGTELFPRPMLDTLLNIIPGEELGELEERNETRTDAILSSPALMDRIFDYLRRNEHE